MTHLCDAELVAVSGSLLGTTVWLVTNGRYATGAQLSVARIAENSRYRTRGRWFRTKEGAKL
jgi:hypothetical protein